MKTKLFKTKVLLLFAVFAIHLNAQAQLLQSQTNATQSTALQQAKENPAADIHNPENQSPFDAVKGLKEDLSKRDAFSKHYINEDGSFTALIGAGPIHYERNGQFLDIDHTITQSSTMNFPFANTTNLMESYFGATVEYGVKSKTMEGEVVEFMNPTMYWEVNGQAMGTQQAANTQAQIQADKATYPNIYGDISAEYKVLTGKREMNYIIPNPQALGAVPAGADYLVFTEDVVLPFGWTSSLTETGIMIKDAMGQEIYLYENPHSTDAESHALREENTIFETLQIGNTLTIKTKVKTAWLLSGERVFPVMVDPTTNVYPNNATNWTRSIYSNGTVASVFRIGLWSDGNWVRGFAKFNTSSITEPNIQVNSVVGWIYRNYSSTTISRNWQWTDSSDPTVYSGSNLYNSVNLGYSNIVSIGTANGWKSSTFYNPEGNEYIKNSISNGFISVGLNPNGTYAYGQFYNLDDHTSSNRPYLVINWEPISSDRTLEVVGAGDEASHADGSYTYDNDTPLLLESGTKAGYELMGWTGTGSVPATGTLGALTFNITQNSSIEWLWEAIQPEFHNYGGEEQLAFNNSKINTENPVFRLSHKGGTANGYQIQISNSADFTSGTVSQTFTGTFAADEENNFTFTNGSFTSGTTYYVRAAVDMGGGYLTDGWTTETYSFTYQDDQEIPSWFQTTQAQFETDELVGVNANASHDVVTNPGGNMIVNGTFANTSGWATHKTWNGLIIEVSSTDCVNCPVGTTRNLKFSDWAESDTGDFMVVSQQVDLTNVDEITYNANSYYNSGYNPPTNRISSLRFIIGGSSTDEVGTTLHTTEQAFINSSYQSISSSDPNITINTSEYTGIQTIKFVVSFTSPGYVRTALINYFVNNVEAISSSSGSITSTPIHLASVQDTEGYLGLRWNQTLNGGDMTLKVQHSADGETGWTDVPGYTDISAEGDGEQYFDLELMEAYPHIRLVADLDGEGVTLHDWEVTFMKDQKCADETTWDGTTWSSTPGETKKLIFNANYTSSGDLRGCAIEVKNNAVVIISEGDNVTIDNEIKVATGASFTLKDGANLVQINDDAVNEGEITVEKLFTFSEGREQYNLIGSPVLGQNLKAIYDGNPKTQIYNELNNWFDTSDGVYTLGVGQSINEAKVADEPNSLTTAIFEGVPFNGKHTLSGLTAQKTGFHLIANPYPSQLDLDQLYTDNLDLEPRFLFWDNRGNEQLTQYGDGYQGDHYAQYNALSGGIAAQGETVVDQTKVPNGLAAVGSAFMVRLTTPGMIGNINFNNAQRAVGKGVDFLGKTNDASEKDRYWLTLTTPTNWQVMQLVAYFEGGNDDYGLDDNKAPNSSTGFYSILNNHHLAIQGKSSFAVSDTIALGYRAFEVGKHRINLFKQEGVFVNGQSIYLIDHELDTVHNLSESLYEFETEVGEFNERFLIVYQEDEVLSSLDLASVGLQVFRQNKKTVIRSLNQDLKALKVFNLNGQLLLDNDNLSGKYYHLPEGRFGKQVLLLNITTADGRIHSVKVLTH